MVDIEEEPTYVNLRKQETKRGYGEGRFRGTNGVLVVVVDDVDVIYMRAEVAFTARTARERVRNTYGKHVARSCIGEIVCVYARVHVECVCLCGMRVCMQAGCDHCRQRHRSAR